MLLQNFLRLRPWEWFDTRNVSCLHLLQQYMVGSIGL
jgi:hypothetical protein